MTLAIEPNVVR